MLEVNILNEKLERVSVIDNFESLIWTDRIGEAGDFELYAYRSSDLLQVAKPGYYATIRESDFVMIIETIRLTTDIEDGDRVIITGRSLESLLDRRVVWEKTHFNGNIQNGIKHLLNDAIISPSDENRKIDNFIFEESTDEDVTKLQTRVEYYGDNLYDILVEICQVFNIGYRIRLSDEGKFVFKLYAGKDHSFDQETRPWIIYSTNYDNLISSEFTESTSDVKNVAMIVGDAKQDKDSEGNYYGLIRRLSTTLGEETGLNRKEIFVDASDISREDVSDDVYKQYLEYRGYEELYGYTSSNDFSREVDTKHSFHYGIDYGLGDFVQFQNQYGIGVKVYVTEYTINEESSGLREYPTFSQDYAEPSEPTINVNLVGANLYNWSYVVASHKDTSIIVENEDLWHNHVTYNTGSGWEILYKTLNNLDTTKAYTVSFEYKNITGWEPSDNGYFGLLITSTSPTNAATSNIVARGVLQQEAGYSEQVSFSFVPTRSTMYIVINGGYLKDNSTYKFIIDHIKIEEGETPTIWSRKPPNS